MSKTSYLELLASLIKSEGKTADAVKADVCKHLKVEADAKVVTTMEWLGLFSDEKVLGGAKTALDALCNIMMEKMPYKEGERDMLLMRHGFVAEYPDKVETLSSTMVSFGIKDGDSAMARTVSLPMAMATNMVLTGKFTKPGLSIPSCAELYTPILDELASIGVTWEEKVEESKKK